MPFPRPQLDLVLAPTDPERPFSEAGVETLLGAWRRSGILAPGPSGTAGPLAPELVPGGFRAVRVERHDQVAFWSNHQGGFRAFCSACGTLQTAAFSAAVTAWRTGGPRTWRCPACGVEAALEYARLLPEGVFARWAVVIGGVEEASVRSDAEREINAALGPVRFVWRRVG